MNIELVHHSGINLVTKREQFYDQYLIYEGHPLKKQLIGLIGWKEGCKAIFLAPIDPIKKERVIDRVSELMKKKLDAVECPDIDQDLVNPPEQDLYDEFNESDLT